MEKTVRFGKEKIVKAGLGILTELLLVFALLAAAFLVAGIVNLFLHR